MKIRTKLLSGILIVIGFFAASGIFTVYQVKNVSKLSQQAIEEYWPTNDLIMETSILADKLYPKVLKPPGKEAGEQLIAETHKSLSRLQEKFRATSLAFMDIEQVTHKLQELDEAVAKPIRLHWLPGELMEEADSAVASVLEKAQNLHDPELINTIWCSVMSFNDILITGDPAERDNFDIHNASISSSPQFAKLRDCYNPFKTKGLAVFTAAIDLQNTQDNFKEKVKNLNLTLEDLENRYKKQVVEPGAERIMKTLRTVPIAITVSILMASFFTIIMGWFLTQSISKPLEKNVEMISAMQKGRVNQRLEISKKEESEDEIVKMAYAMNSFADNLENEVVAVLSKMASGDFTYSVIPVDDRDVVRMALQKVETDLSLLIANIHSATEELEVGANHVSESAQSLAQGATEQAAALEEITSSMAEISSQTQINADNAQQANQLAGHSREVAEKGNSHMQEMIDAMGEINESSSKISRIIKVIDEIAFQTNLLALNAAVEAARAGKHGKGFAVVAEEVRNLAARSAKAARETAELIDESVQKAENGTQIANQTAEVLAEIVTSAQKVTDLVGEIAAASNEQATGIAQIDKGLAQIDQVTQQSTANTEESASAAEELSGQAKTLQQMLENFKVNQEDNDSPPRRPVKLASPGKTQEWPKQQARRLPETVIGKTRQCTPEDIISLDDKEFGRF